MDKVEQVVAHDEVTSETETTSFFSSTTETTLEDQLELFKGLFRETSLLEKSVPDIRQFTVSTKFTNLLRSTQQDVAHNKSLSSLIFFGPDLGGDLNAQKVILAKWFARQAGLDYIHIHAADFKSFESNIILGLLDELFLFIEQNTHKCVIIIESIEEIAQPDADNYMWRTNTLSERQSKLLCTFLHHVERSKDRCFLIALCNNPYLSTSLFSLRDQMFFFSFDEDKIRVS